MSSYQINLEAAVKRFQFDEDKVRQITKKILSTENINEALVNVIFVDDKQITGLNKKYLHKDSATDVISFLLESDTEKKSLEGEVYANLEQIERQALEYKTTKTEEFFRIIIHGVLHLVGYNDLSPTDKKNMTKKEDFYLTFI
ncbi:rRNA maturation RNase YbeY [candidate division KSB1 bacterium]|nr:rRNA maturation RNase YbeY [candidate division KSB1 bacterium]MBL7095085.1 rRNA maturation RNase YbeY [candidate division KSB1 bacterium]